MFAQTDHLTLRPGTPADAAALAAAIAFEEVVRMTARVPWPYRLADAVAFLAEPPVAHRPHCLIVTRGPRGAPRLIGGIGLSDAGAFAEQPDAAELGYWLTPAAWGHGYATQAARAMIDHARDTLGITRIHAGHFADNPASGRVLRKLGFVPTGAVVAYPSLARGGSATAIRYALDLGR